ncbi:hypothetical protein GCM10007874_57020 [Labrys miyagiensis]|uniref:Uncharacterized protein n=1 Tax=Labrys miyagiensis TaxID=346912 RepID=A0ABQ6CQR2_9HYPH|nr:hypothetical protein [Labrys miyagiensis]GLS22682.1 hypothetical protein GCM10007874_57020 [Labrys miyagiensis]
MPAASAQGYRTVMSNPSLTDRKLLTAMQLLTDGSPIFAGFNGHIVDARKRPSSILLTFSFSKYVPNAGQVYGLARADVTASEVSVIVAGAPTIAKARQRLSLAQ